MSHAFHALTELAREDAEYAWTLQCNLAVPIMDSVRCTHEQANRAAARIMRQWFSVDITKHEHWKGFEREWKFQCPQGEASANSQGLLDTSEVVAEAPKGSAIESPAPISCSAPSAPTAANRGAEPT